MISTLLQSLPVSLCQYQLSQNNRKAVVGRDLWRSSCPTPLLKQDHLEWLAQDHVQMAYQYLQGWRLLNLSGKPVSALTYGKKVFPYVQMALAVVQFLPIASRPFTVKNLAPPYLCSPLGYL